MAFASDAAGDAPLAGFLVDLFLGFNKPQAFGTAWAQILADEWLATVGNLAVVLEAHRKGDSAAWESVVLCFGKLNPAVPEAFRPIVVHELTKTLDAAVPPQVTTNFLLLVG